MKTLFSVLATRAPRAAQPREHIERSKQSPHGSKPDRPITRRSSARLKRGRRHRARTSASFTPGQRSPTSNRVTERACQGTLRDPAANMPAQRRINRAFASP
jgi:hypothetical protein